ncbi:Na+/H+ antiporter NhaA [Intrasporangium calvum]|uniref:Na(+)/H(+) antiporter NhaA n=1 Tax=Intrasporangium calvum (strain ATCC 23552 / DSM 43043 / JCM 3097 / NBRC 12989 / NCIMB 10167 / NRRL B-3866 / 7 KIP) TaxID=710696 RepID=E6SEK9_INTC7|nr:Na+/H+ antiporter NhaA [Intrasporangium calvum]ADU46610.1 sodium/proton antiporter, NhaA family [Intrasporangium calvum DSM 43043]
MATTTTAPRRHQLGGQLSAPLRRFLATESGGAVLLVVATLVALGWANSTWSETYSRIWSTELAVEVADWALRMDLHHWINDGLMAVFFLVIGLEVRRDLSVGELTDRRKLRLPLLAGLGGMVVPAVLYLLVNSSGEAANGWGVVIGTDTAFLLGTLALVGPATSTQLRVFLLTLTVVDDIVAVSVIGLVYSDDLDAVALAVALAAVAVLVALGRSRVWRTWPYALTILALWLATVASGLHASVAGMVAGLLVPSFAPRRQAVEQAARRFHAFRQSPLADVGRSAQDALVRAVPVNERMQLVLHPWTSYFIVPVFALANAGVDLRGGVLGEALRSPVTWGIVLGLVLGKFVGIGGVALLGSRLGVGRLPQGVGPGQILGGGALSGIGFTVSLLIVGLAFGPELQDEATVGVLLALVLATLLGWLVFTLAAVLHGETTAGLPTVLDRPVDPERDHVRGSVTAPLTLVEYADFECPFCGRATGVVAEVRAHFGADLRYVMRHLPLPDVHPHAELAALAVESAGAQGRFWEMHDLLFEHQGQLETEDLAGYASELGLDVERFLRDLDDEVHSDRIREDVRSAEASGARGTPTFFVGDQRHVGPYDAQTLIAELEASRRDPAREERPRAGHA